MSTQSQQIKHYPQENHEQEHEKQHEQEHFTQSNLSNLQNQQGIKNINLNIKSQSQSASSQLNTQKDGDDTAQKYGPFNQKKNNNANGNNALMNTANYQIQPVVNMNTKNKIKNEKKNQNKDSEKVRISVCFKFTEESQQNQNQNHNDLSQIQKKILQIAKDIRIKVKNEKQKQKPIRISYDNSNSNKKKMKDSKTLPTNTFLTPINNRMSKFNSIQLGRSKLINKEYEVSIEDEGEYKKQTSINYAQQKVKSIVQKQSVTNIAQPEHESDSAHKVVKSIINQIVKNIVKSSQQNKKAQKIQLKLDPVHHHYETTQFRKSILKQKKYIKTRQLVKKKQKETILTKRRQIYYNSRYHPVGIKLPKLNKAYNLELSHKDKGLQSNFNVNYSCNGETNIIKAKLNETDCMDQNFTQNKNEIQMQIQNKSYQSFNSSLILNPEVKQMRTQSELYKDLTDLTKQFQNDSTPIEKMQQKTIILLKRQSKSKSQSQSEHINNKIESKIENNHEANYFDQHHSGRDELLIDKNQSFTNSKDCDDDQNEDYKQNSNNMRVELIAEYERISNNNNEQHVVYKSKSNGKGQFMQQQEQQQ